MKYNCLLFVVATLVFNLLCLKSTAGENLLLNGNFELVAAEPGVLPGWKKTIGNWNIINENGNRYLRLKNDQQKSSAYVSQNIALNPKWKKLKLKAKVRVKRITSGKLSWHDARLALCQKIPGKNNHYCPVLHWDAPQAEWKECEIDIPIKEGAVLLGFSPAIFNAVGDMDVDDISISVCETQAATNNNKADVPGKDAGDSKNVYAGTEMGPVEKLSNQRELICLNGKWAFTPADRKLPPKPSEWGEIWVPGSWRPGSLRGVGKRGKGKVWHRFNENPTAWYQRKIKIPENWKGKKIEIDIERISTDAVVYIDGKRCGEINFPGGTLDITKFVTPGKESILRVFVLSVNDKDYVYRYMGPGEGQIIKEKAILSNRGIVGDVFLNALPKRPLIDSALIETSTSNKELTLRINAINLKKDSPVTVELKIFDNDGQCVKQKEGEISADKDELRLSIPWDNARLWSTDDPYLYNAVIKVKNGDSADEVKQRFGFREFSIKGKNFYLNGTPIRLRPVVYGESRLARDYSAIEKAVKAIKESGFNFMEMWPWDRHSSRGSFHSDEKWLEVADRYGLLIAAPVAEVRQFWEKWDMPGIKEFWAKRVRSDINKYGTHPSVVVWTGGANIGGFCDDQDPSIIGQEKLANPDTAQYNAKKLKSDESIQIVKNYDPTRPVYWHAGAACGDIYTLNCYLNLIPLQEREEWLSEWAKNGDMPVLMIEFGEPLCTTYMRGRHGYGHAQSSEPLLTEFAAAYLGKDAYTDESKNYRDSIGKHFIKDQKYKTYHISRVLDREITNQKLKAEFVTKTWRSWRTWGITGGMIAWSKGNAWVFPHYGAISVKDKIKMPAFYPGKRGGHHDLYSKSYLNGMGKDGMERLSTYKNMIEAVADTMAYIGGKKGEFTDKTHNFVQGKSVNKQAVVINDTLKEQVCKGKWQAFVGGKMIAEGAFDQNLKPAEILKKEIVFNLPEISTPKQNGEIKLNATIAGNTHLDTFKFRVFQLPEMPKQKLVIWDPVGDTRAYLKSMGYELSNWDGSQVNDILVIGRNALKNGEKMPGDLDLFVKNGGKAIVFAQDPDYLRNKKQFRVSRYISRRVFPVDKKHPVVKGIDAEDLSDWAGYSTLVADKETPAVSIPKYPSYGWHWGNRGGVATSSIEKPHKSGWRPILECEFDLAYSPLMELNYGKGMIILNMLDVEKRGQVEPVANIMTKNIIDHLAAASPVTETVVYYSGNEAGGKMLDSLGIAYKKVDQIPVESAILLVGEGSPLKRADIDSFAEKGGAVVVLPQNMKSPIVADLKLKKQNMPGSVNVPDWAEVQGISPSDLRWRVEQPAAVITAGCELGANGLLGRQKKGKGVILWMQTAPETLDYKTKTYLRFTNWRQMRMLTQILANLGARFDADRNFFKENTDIPVKLDGEWQYVATKKLPSTDIGNHHPDSGISPAAAEILKGKQADWQKIDLPADIDWFTKYDGEAVFKKEITIPESWANRDLTISLGPIDDFDTTYFNGQEVGKMDIKTPGFWNKSREYTIPAKLVKPGKATIMVRVFDHYGGGGMYGRREQLYIKPVDSKSIDYYSSDYITKFDIGDDPFRYYRW